MNVPKFKNLKNKSKITMVTCYDASFAKSVEKSDVDAVLVGDSVAMVIYGYDSTIHASVEMIASHVKAVRKSYSGMIVADLPFLSVQKEQTDFINDIKLLMEAGANAIKIEGVEGVEDKIKSVISSGVPVMGHVGLTPQFVNKFGGFKVQGRTDEGKKIIASEAKKLEQLGCFSVVLECVPGELAEEITKSVLVPTIGIGAGVHTDGQILVLQDLLGLSDMNLKFVKQYESFGEKTVVALNSFAEETKKETFPQPEHVFL